MRSLGGKRKRKHISRTEWRKEDPSKTRVAWQKGKAGSEEDAAVMENARSYDDDTA